MILSWKEVEILTRVKKRERKSYKFGNRSSIGCGNSMALLIEWLEATV